MVYGQLIFVKKNGEDGTKFPITNKLNIIGKSDVCNIKIKREQVSQEHCEIIIENNDQAAVKNLSFINPVSINGKMTFPGDKVNLAHGDLIKVSDRIIRWEYVPTSIPFSAGSANLSPKKLVNIAQTHRRNTMPASYVTTEKDVFIPQKNLKRTSMRETMKQSVTKKHTRKSEPSVTVDNKTDSSKVKRKGSVKLFSGRRSLQPDKIIFSPKVSKRKSISVVDRSGSSSSSLFLSPLASSSSSTSGSNSFHTPQVLSTKKNIVRTPIPKSGLVSSGMKKTPVSKSLDKIKKTSGRKSLSSKTPFLQTIVETSPPKIKLSTPGSKSGTPKIKLSTPGSKSGTPKIKLSTPGSKSGTPKIKLSTPGSKSGTPKIKLSTPGSKSGTPKIKLSTPGSKSGTPKIKLSTPGSKSGTPKIKLSTPGSKSGTPKSKLSTPGSKSGTPKIKLSTPGSASRTPRSSGRNSFPKAQQKLVPTANKRKMSPNLSPAERAAKRLKISIPEPDKNKKAALLVLSKAGKKIPSRLQQQKQKTALLATQKIVKKAVKHKLTKPKVLAVRTQLKRVSKNIPVITVQPPSPTPVSSRKSLKATTPVGSAKNDVKTPRKSPKATTPVGSAKNDVKTPRKSPKATTPVGSAKNEVKTPRKSPKGTTPVGSAKKGVDTPQKSRKSTTSVGSGKKEVKTPRKSPKATTSVGSGKKGVRTPLKSHRSTTPVGSAKKDVKTPRKSPKGTTPVGSAKKDVKTPRKSPKGTTPVGSAKKDVKTPRKSPKGTTPVGSAKKDVKTPRKSPKATTPVGSGKKGVKTPLKSRKSITPVGSEKRVKTPRELAKSPGQSSSATKSVKSPGQSPKTPVSSATKSVTSAGQSARKTPGSQIELSSKSQPISASPPKIPRKSVKSLFKSPQQDQHVESPSKKSLSGTPRVVLDDIFPESDKIKSGSGVTEENVPFNSSKSEETLSPKYKLQLTPSSDSLSPKQIDLNSILPPVVPINSFVVRRRSSKRIISKNTPDSTPDYTELSPVVFGLTPRNVVQLPAKKRRSSSLTTPRVKNNAVGIMKSASTSKKNRKTVSFMSDCSVTADGTLFDFDSVKTPDVTQDVFVSPLDHNNKRRTRGPHNDLSDVSGVRNLFKTSNEVKNDLTNIPSVRQLLLTPGKHSPKNDLTNIGGIRTLFSPQKSPHNDLTDVSGVKELLLSSPDGAGGVNSLHTIESINSLRDVENLFTLFVSGDGRKRKSPRNDLTNISGLSELFETNSSDCSAKRMKASETPVKTNTVSVLPKRLRSAKKEKTIDPDSSTVRMTRARVATPKPVPSGSKIDISPLEGREVQLIIKPVEVGTKVERKNRKTKREEKVKKTTEKKVQDSKVKKTTAKDKEKKPAVKTKKMAADTTSSPLISPVPQTRTRKVKSAVKSDVSDVNKDVVESPKQRAKSRPPSRRAEVKQTRAKTSADESPVVKKVKRAKSSVVGRKENSPEQQKKTTRKKVQVKKSPPSSPARLRRGRTATATVADDLSTSTTSSVSVKKRSVKTKLNKEAKEASSSTEVNKPGGSREARQLNVKKKAAVTAKKTVRKSLKFSPPQLRKTRSRK